jgi:hypothetical protein
MEHWRLLANESQVNSETVAFRPEMVNLALNAALPAVKKHPNGVSVRRNPANSHGAPPCFFGGQELGILKVT